jgi:hypothetical protein
MRVIKEGYVLYHIAGKNYVCMQNTQTPKVYASKKKAIESAGYRNVDNDPQFKVEKVFLVTGEDDDNQAI